MPKAQATSTNPAGSRRDRERRQIAAINTATPIHPVTIRAAGVMLFAVIMASKPWAGLPDTSTRQGAPWNTFADQGERRASLP